jgi:AcrR family transcriptional regulator
MTAGARATPLRPSDILDATEQVLRRHGPTKATVVDVSRALGVSHGSVYRHFPTKRALRRAVTERWLEQVIAPLAAIASADGPPLDRARRWFATLNETKRRLSQDDPDLFATYLDILDDSPEMVDTHVSALLGQLAMIIRQGANDGTIRTDDPAARARALFHAMSRFHHPRHVTYWQHPDMARDFDDVWDLLLAGLRT